VTDAYAVPLDFEAEEYASWAADSNCSREVSAWLAALSAALFPDDARYFLLMCQQKLSYAGGIWDTLEVINSPCVKCPRRPASRSLVSVQSDRSEKFIFLA
jgi:hypothetical protein